MKQNKARRELQVSDVIKKSRFSRRMSFLISDRNKASSKNMTRHQQHSVLLPVSEIEL